MEKSRCPCRYDRSIDRAFSLAATYRIPVKDKRLQQLAAAVWRQMDTEKYIKSLEHSAFVL